MASKNKPNHLPSTGGQSPKKILSSMSYVEKARCLHDDWANYGVKFQVSFPSSKEFKEMKRLVKKLTHNKRLFFIPRKVQAAHSYLYFQFEAQSKSDFLKNGPIQSVYSCYQTDAGEEEAALFVGKDYSRLVFYTEECMKDYAEFVQQPELSLSEILHVFFASNNSMGTATKTANGGVVIVVPDGYCIGEYVSSTIFACKSFVSKDSFADPIYDDIRAEITKRTDQI